MNLVRIWKGKDGRLIQFLGVEEDLEKKTRRKENWAVLGKASPFLFFPTTFAMLERSRGLETPLISE